MSASAQALRLVAVTGSVMGGLAVSSPESLMSSLALPHEHLSGELEIIINWWGVTMLTLSLAMLIITVPGVAPRRLCVMALRTMALPLLLGLAVVHWHNSEYLQTNGRDWQPLWRQVAVIAIGSIATIAGLYIDRPKMCRRADAEPQPHILVHEIDNEKSNRGGLISRMLLMLLAFQWLAFAACLWFAPEVYLLTFVRSVLVQPSNGFHAATAEEKEDVEAGVMLRREPPTTPTVDTTTVELQGLQAVVTAYWAQTYFGLFLAFATTAIFNNSVSFQRWFTLAVALPAHLLPLLLIMLAPHHDSDSIEGAMPSLLTPVVACIVVIFQSTIPSWTKPSRDTRSVTTDNNGSVKKDD